MFFLEGQSACKGVDDQGRTAPHEIIPLRGERRSGGLSPETAGESRPRLSRAPRYETSSLLLKDEQSWKMFTPADQKALIVAACQSFGGDWFMFEANSFAATISPCWHKCSSVVQGSSPEIMSRLHCLIVLLG